MSRRQRTRRPASPDIVIIVLLLFGCLAVASGFVVVALPPRLLRQGRLVVHAATTTGSSSKKSSSSSGGGGGGGGNSSPKSTLKPKTGASGGGGGGHQRGKKAGTGASSPSASGGAKGKGAETSAAAGSGKQSKALGNAFAWALSESKALPAFDTPAPALAAEQLLSFERKGHTVTRGLCRPEEVADWAKVVRAAFEKDKLLALRQKVRVLLGKEAYAEARTVEDCEEMLEEEVDPEYIPFLQTFNSWRRYQDVRCFALASRFAHVAAQLLGVPRVRLYQDSSFLKRDGDGPTLWHSDLAMAPFNSNELVTMWMPMTEVPPEEEGGTGLCFANGSGRDFALSYWDDPHASEDLSERYAVESYGRMLPGDASWHHGWCLHSSAENLTGRDRLAFTLAFVAADAPLLGKHAKNRPHDEDDLSYADWLGDFKPGERLRDHPFLPLVWDDDDKQQGKRGGRK